MSRYFFGYDGVDCPLASDVVSGLQSSDIDVWWNQNGLSWGEDWQDKLQEGRMSRDAYILLLGKLGIRRWVEPEFVIVLCRHYESN